MTNRLRYVLLPKKIKIRWSYDDFLYYRMQEMDQEAIDSLLTPIELINIERKLNRDDFRYIFNSKKEFYNHFSRFIRRDILNATDYTLDEFMGFAEKYKRIIIKPDNMYAGIGIYVLELSGKSFHVISSGARDDTDVSAENTASYRMLKDGYESTKAVYDFCKMNDYCIEEYIEGHRVYSKVSPSSLNTIRVTTYLNDDKKPSIIFAANQFGYKGCIVDNNDNSCIWGLIDLETGAVTDVDIDTATGNIYEKHPDSGQDIVGFKNYNFEAVKKLALEAALVIPECRLIGWDIAVRSDGTAEIIEGNVTPELDLYQAISHKGLRTVLI